jgi:magnesium-transporting ATPase (P-type)
MGKSGTDLAQQAAAIILLDDNVATLVSAIQVIILSFSLFSFFS